MESGQEMKIEDSERVAISTMVAVSVVIVVVAVVGVGSYLLMRGTGGSPSTTTTSSTSSSSTTTSTSSTTTTSASQAYTIRVGTNANVGRYLENGSGVTLYMFAADLPGNGTSACTGSCAAAWPPFYASSLTLPSGLSPSNFSTITRPDGSKQTAYNGWPLYYYVADTSAGSMFGEGLNQFGGLWYAIPPTLQQSGGQIVGGSPYNVGVAYKPSIGLYLTNGTGFALYFRATDTANSGTTTCNTSICEKNWPVFYTAALKLAPGLSTADFGTITPYNSTRIVTYDGYALFYWIGDAAPGDTLGQGIGSFYAATVPTPVAPTTTTTTTTTTSTTTTSTTSSYTNPYGY